MRRHYKILLFALLCLTNITYLAYSYFTPTKFVFPKFKINIPEHAQRGGRLFVILAKDDEYEPRLLLEASDLDEKPIAIAVDVDNEGSALMSLDDAVFPQAVKQGIEEGKYYVQALLDISQDTKSLNSSGNLFSAVARMKIKADSVFPIEISLSQAISEFTPTDTHLLKHVTIKSELLSKFHGRPIMLNAGIILPADYHEKKGQLYPLWVHIGGGNSSYLKAKYFLASNRFKKTWAAEDTPRFIFIHLDNRGPFGCPYQVNSPINGPYGDAITKELIPYIERKYRGGGASLGRYLQGSSSGGWSALALQSFYPDYFNGAWIGQPDPVDLRAFMQTNLYDDKSIFVDQLGNPRPGYRAPWWTKAQSIREEFEFENFVGLHNSYVYSGLDWGAWNAVYAPRNFDGSPAALWNKDTGAINQDAMMEATKHDLRKFIESNWDRLGKSLQGKIHVWVGEEDTYFLDGAVRLLEASLSKLSPPYSGWFMYGYEEDHEWSPLSVAELLREMKEQMDSNQ